MPFDNSDDDSHGWGNEPSHDGENLRALANLLQMIFIQTGQKMELCPGCAMNFVTARIIAYHIFAQFNGDETRERIAQDVIEELATIGKLVGLELQRLHVAKGQLDGPMPMTAVIGGDDDDDRPTHH